MNKMAIWFHTFDDQFWILIAGLVIGFLSVVAKSKCERCGVCCGCIEIERNVQAELVAERQEQALARARSRPLTRANSVFGDMQEMVHQHRSPNDSPASVRGSKSIVGLETV